MPSTRRKKAGKKELAEEIRRKTQGAGYEVDEITALLRGRRGRTRTGSYTTWVEPDDASKAPGKD